jgi:flagellar hook protein FlgE
MMTQAYYTGLSGLKNSSDAIDVVSNNLANVNTTGYRSYEAEFASLFESSVSETGSLGDAVGEGVRLQTTTMSTEQGAVYLTDRNTDLAIQGEGWFSVQGDGEPLYTRDGSFMFDSNDDLVTADGFHVLGTKGNNISDDNVLTGKIDEMKLSDVDSQEKLRFPKTLTYPSEPTTTAKFMANLGTGYEPVTVGASVIDPQNNSNHLRLEFRKKETQVSPGSQYDVIATITSPDSKEVYSSVDGEVTFDAAGGLVSSTLTSIDNNGQNIDIDLGTKFDGIISIDTTELVPGSSITDGTIGGDLVGYSINKNAEVIATFTNGEQSSVGKIGVYHFQNEQGLNRVSGTRFQESSNSGEAFFYKNADGENINGTNISNFTLENSNVDLTNGLTELIILQRSYDANSKSITTADQMIQKALNMDG